MSQNNQKTFGYICNPTDIKAYIDEVNLEQYCFRLFDAGLGNEVGALRLDYPKVRRELHEIELAIEQLALSQAITPRPQLKNKIMSALFAEETIDLHNLPPTSKFSNYESWLKAVEHLIPTEPFDDFFAHALNKMKKSIRHWLLLNWMFPKKSMI